MQEVVQMECTPDEKKKLKTWNKSFYIFVLRSFLDSSSIVLFYIYEKSYVLLKY